MVDYKIYNMVLSSYLTQDEFIDLYDIAARLPGATLMDAAEPMVVSYTQSDPKTAQLIFDDGKVISTGAKSLAAAGLSLSNLGEKLFMLGYKVNMKPHARIDNVVIRTSLDKRLDLYKLAAKLDDAEFNPEEFPGIILKETKTRGEGDDSKDYELATLIFGSGKVVITGHQGSSAEEVLEDLQKSCDSITAKIEDLTRDFAL